MKNSKLIVFLKTLSSTEMREWGKYIEANSTKNVESTMLFFEYLQKQYPKFEEAKIEKELIAEKLYPEEKNGVKKIDNLIYKFWSILENYLVMKEIENQPRQKELFLLDALKYRKLDKYFFKKADELEKEWTENIKDGAENYLNLYKLKMGKLTHSNFKEKKNVDELRKAERDLEKHYLSSRFIMNAGTVITKEQIIDKQVVRRIIDIDKLIELVDQKEICKDGFLKYYYEVYEESVKEKFEIKKLKSKIITYKNYYQSLSNSEKIDVSNILLICLLKHYNNGNLEALNEIHELNKFMAEKKILIGKNYTIEIPNFHSIVNIACAVGKTEWAISFVDNYKKYLKTEYKEDVVSIAKSSIYMREKKYEKVLQNLAQVKFQYITDQLISRTLLLISYFELDNYEVMFINKTKSFRLFLLRNKEISDKSRKSFNNFIKYINKLYDIKYKNGSHKIKLIKKEIEKENEIVYKSWLFEKINEYEKGSRL